MTKNSESAAAIVVAGPNVNDRFDQTSILLHWLTVLFIVVQFASIWTREAVDHQSRLAAELFSLHLAAGVLTWFVVVVRVFWRHCFAYLPPFPPSMPKFQQTVAKANEYGLYLLLLMQPATGLARVLLRGQAFDLFSWHIPALLEPNPALRGIFVEAHDTGARIMMLLIGLHAVAALFHRLVLRDDVLQRMLPRMTVRTKLTAALAGEDAE